MRVCASISDSLRNEQNQKSMHTMVYITHSLDSRQWFSTFSTLGIQILKDIGITCLQLYH